MEQSTADEGEVVEVGYRLQPLDPHRGLIRLGQKNAEGVIRLRAPDFQTAKLIERLLHHELEDLKLLRQFLHGSCHLLLQLCRPSGRRKDEDLHVRKKISA